MSRTSWSIDGPDDTVVELKGRKFATSDDGAPMMCNLFCQDMGRHVHVDYCRATEEAPCDGAEVEHIDVPMAPNPDQPKDWISHSLFWKRSGTTGFTLLIMSSSIMSLSRFQGWVALSLKNRQSLSRCDVYLRPVFSR
jgi:hypothetical protein